MSIFVTGDVHGDLLKRFSFRNMPELRSLTSNDTVIILGDIGVPWPLQEKENEYQLKWLSEKPWNTIFLLGNHDDYDWASTLPLNGSQLVYNDNIYNNISVYWKIASINIEGKKILLIPGGDSHDYDLILDPNAENFKSTALLFRKNNILFRTLGLNWWKQESVDVDTINKMLEDTSILPKYDYILSHDFPGSINKIWKREGTPGRLISTPGQDALEELRKQVKFDHWIHGHAHDPFMPWDRIDDRIHCVYRDIEELI